MCAKCCRLETGQIIHKIRESGSEVIKQQGGETALLYVGQDKGLVYKACMLQTASLQIMPWIDHRQQVAFRPMAQ